MTIRPRTEEENNNLGWMLSSIENLAGVSFAAVLSSDGLEIARSAGLGKDEADTFAAAMSGLYALVKAGAQFVGGGGARQFVCEYDTGIIMVTTVAQNAVLGVGTTNDADVSVVSQTMESLAPNLRKQLQPDDRRPGFEGGVRP